MYRQSVEEVQAWLHAKGERSTLSENECRLTYEDGRLADLLTDTIEGDDGALHSFTLTEPIQEGVFRTRIEVAWQESKAEVHCELSVGGPSPGIVPVRFDARCPGSIRSIVDQGGWSVGTMNLRSSPLALDGASGGRELIDLLWAADRQLPVVVVSDYDGLLLHPDIDERIAYDVSGLALVTQIDRVAAWTLTEERGKDWSCFNGAIRLYWPMSEATGDPHDHPLWTQYRLLLGASSTFDAAKRIRNQLRRSILGQSAFSVRSSQIASSIRQLHRQRDREEIERQREQAADAKDWQDLAENLDADNELLKGDLRDLKDENRDLKVQLQNLKLALQYSGDGDEVIPDEEVPPQSVYEAVETARVKFADFLEFGADVADGIDGLRADAGPPDKVLRYLEKLAELTRLRRAGGLGTDPLRWLAAEGVDASGEGEQVRNSPTEMGKRTWNDGTGSREFTLHLKPKEATTPDACVRIYFDYDDGLRKTVVGWVGRHP